MEAARMDVLINVTNGTIWTSFLFNHICLVL